jgi:hypothetical protein
MVHSNKVPGGVFITGRGPEYNKKESLHRERTDLRVDLKEDSLVV